MNTKTVQVTRATPVSPPARRVTTHDQDNDAGHMCRHCGGEFDWSDIHHDSYDYSTDQGVVCYCRDCYDDHIDPTCRECDGAGYVIQVGRLGGVWNRSVGAYEPDEYEVRCGACDGRGEVLR